MNKIKIIQNTNEVAIIERKRSVWNLTLYILGTRIISGETKLCSHAWYRSKVRSTKIKIVQYTEEVAKFERKRSAWNLSLLGTRIISVETKLFDVDASFASLVWRGTHVHLSFDTGEFLWSVKAMAEFTSHLKSIEWISRDLFGPPRLWLDKFIGVKTELHETKVNCPERMSLRKKELSEFQFGEGISEDPMAPHCENFTAQWLFMCFPDWSAFKKFGAQKNSDHHQKNSHFYPVE